MRFLQISIELLFDLGPYVLCGIAGAYAEAKWGSKAKALAAKEFENLKLEIAALRVKL